MPVALATADDVADIWRPLTDAERAQAESLVMKASAMLRGRCPFDVDARLALSPSDPWALNAMVVATVVAKMVKRVMANTDGAASVTETVGPYSKSSTYAGDDGRGDLIVTEGDIAALRPARSALAAGTIRTRVPRWH